MFSREFMVFPKNTKEAGGGEGGPSEKQPPHLLRTEVVVSRSNGVMRQVRAGFNEE